MTQPLTRDLNETIRSLEVSEAELLFQAERLVRDVAPSTDDEVSHLGDLRVGYRDAAKYVRILINYHKGRVGRQRVTRPAGVDAQGRATAHTGDDT